MAAHSGTTTVLVARLAQELLTAANKSHDDHRWDKLHQTELGVSAVRTSWTVSLLLGP